LANQRWINHRKHKNKGWRFVRQQQVKNNQYLLSCESELGAEEIAEEKKKERNRKLGWLILRFACACL
jgi:hypothetical protein